MTTVAQLDVKALNQTLVPLVQACFWGAIATAAMLPIAAAAGSYVAGRIEGKKPS